MSVFDLVADRHWLVEVHNAPGMRTQFVCNCGLIHEDEQEFRDHLIAERAVAKLFPKTPVPDFHDFIAMMRARNEA